MRTFIGGPQGGLDPQAGVSFSIAATANSNPFTLIDPSTARRADQVDIIVTYTNANTQVGSFKVQTTSSSAPATTDWADALVPGVGVVSSGIQPIVFTLTSASGTVNGIQARVVYTSTSSGGADTATIRVFCHANQ